MARTIAEQLHGDLDVVMTRKLHAPGQPEFAIGAVDETGWCYLGDQAAATGAARSYIEEQVAAELATMRRRRAQYASVRPPLDPQGRIVIVVDDGLATGATMIAALHALRERKPARLICAVPVASMQAVEKVKKYADDVVCLETPPLFHAVGQFYRNFQQVDDDEVVALLRASPACAPGQHGTPLPASALPVTNPPARRITHRMLRRIVAVILIGAGGMLMLLAPPVWAGAIPLALGIALELLGTAVEHGRHP